MNAFLLISVLFFQIFSGVMQKQYNFKTENKGVFIFSGMSAGVSMLVFFATARYPLKFNISVLYYSLAFAAAYGVALIFLTLALRYGPMAITFLFLSYSLLIPTFFGIFYLKYKPSVMFYPGMLLLVVSVFLTNYKKESKKKSLKWLIFSLLALLGNGMCSTIQTMQVKNMNGLCSSEFMIAALFMFFIIMLVIVLIIERQEICPSLKKAGVYPVGYGISNGLVNYFVIVLVSKAVIPASVMFPLISGGGIILAFLVAKYYYKEKMTLTQTVGLFVGVASVVLLNL